jgi:hypothetical protein
MISDLSASGMFEDRDKEVAGPDRPVPVAMGMLERVLGDGSAGLVGIDPSGLK